MTIIALIALWLFVPLVFSAVTEIEVRRLRRARNHDRILYTFCEARDVIAIKAIRGELDERSETFRYFYKTLADLIHDHKRHPIGFAHIAKNLLEQKHQPVPTWKRKLLRELKKSDSETKQVVGRYLDAIQLVLHQDSLIGTLDRIPFWWTKTKGELLKNVSNQQFLPRDRRNFARFNLALAKVVNYQPTELAMAA
jgi:hypothetical protein